MKNLILTAMVAIASTMSAQWSAEGDIAVAWDSYNQSLLGVSINDGAITYSSTLLPLLNTSGDYRLVVDGKYVTLTGIGLNDAWITSIEMDEDVRTAIRMIKQGKNVKLQYCEDGRPDIDIFTGTLRGSTEAINATKH